MPRPQLEEPVIANAVGFWTAVHSHLRDHHEASGDQVSGRYHRLALDDIEHVVRALDTDPRLEDDPAGWTADLLTAASAPSRQPATNPSGRVRELAAWAATESRRVRALAELVTAQRVAADPLSDPFGRLTSIIASRWEVLSSEAPSASDVFFTMSQRIRAERQHRDGMLEDLASWRGSTGTGPGGQEPQRITPPTSTRRKALPPQERLPAPPRSLAPSFNGAAAAATCVLRDGPESNRHPGVTRVRTCIRRYPGSLGAARGRARCSHSTVQVKRCPLPGGKGFSMGPFSK